jgi:hypothetical protein
MAKLEGVSAAESKLAGLDEQPFLVVSSAHRHDARRRGVQKVKPPFGCRIGTLDRLCFCEMLMCDEQINLSLDWNMFAILPTGHS